MGRLSSYKPFYTIDTSIYNDGKGKALSTTSRDFYATRGRLNK